MTKARIGLTVLAAALAAWFVAGRGRAPATAPLLAAAADASQPVAVPPRVIVPPPAAAPPPVAPRARPSAPRPSAPRRAPAAAPRKERGAGLRDKGEALGGTPPDRNGR